MPPTPPPLEITGVWPASDAPMTTYVVASTCPVGDGVTGWGGDNPPPPPLGGTGAVDHALGGQWRSGCLSTTSSRAIFGPTVRSVKPNLSCILSYVTWIMHLPTELVVWLYKRIKVTFICPQRNTSKYIDHESHKSCKIETAMSNRANFL